MARASMRRPCQVGSWDDQRVTLDAGQAVNENVAVRFNAMYESSDTFRDYGHLERYGINPTVTLKPTDDTKIKLSYEFYHDFRLADRGNPSQGLARRRRHALQSDRAVRAERQSLDFFGSPIYNNAKVEVQTGMAIIEHDFGNGLTVQERHRSMPTTTAVTSNVYPGGTGAPPAARRRRGHAGPDDAHAQRLRELHTARERLQPDRLRLQDQHRAGAAHASPSAPSSAGRPACRCATAASSRPTAVQVLRSPSIRSTRPISARSPSTTSRPTPTASIGSTSRPPMCRTRSR